MKLLSKYNRINIPITIAALLISSIAFYFILHYVLVYQLDKDLIIEQQEILHFVNEHNILPESSNYKDQQIAFHEIKPGAFKSKFSTVESYNEKEGEDESFRRLEFFVTANGKSYTAEVIKSQQETEDIVQLILIITLSVIVFLLLILFIVNRFLLGKLWKPFYNTLEQLKEFNLTSKSKINFQETAIDEFTELNTTALFMTEKVSKDYEVLKSFTENASHEIQTPLSIIKTKLELLSQSESLDETQVQAMKAINSAATRLSKLNHSLLLLTKIENGQFVDNQPVNISMIISQYLENFEELAEAKNILIDKNIEGNEKVNMNESLAAILISNIISNAIKHNHDNGTIEIKLLEKEFTVSNTGEVPLKQTTQLFERFQKDSSSGDSLGLGLAIVKKICDIYGFSVTYIYEKKRHTIKVIFS
jgi:signal transduction histidine kinase